MIQQSANFPLVKIALNRERFFKILKYFLLVSSHPKSSESLVALTGSANLPFPGLTGLKWRNKNCYEDKTRKATYLLVPLVTTLSPVMEISQRMVSVSLGMRESWGWRSSE